MRQGGLFEVHVSDKSSQYVCTHGLVETKMMFSLLQQKHP